MPERTTLVNVRASSSKTLMTRALSHIVQEVFGTYNVSTAIPNEVTLSKTFQTAIANFVKDPDQSPAPNWPKYVPGNDTKTLARLAYNGNVNTGNFVQAETSDSQVCNMKC